MTIGLGLTLLFGVIIALQFIFSMSGLDTEAEIDIGMGDMVSFKGATHFGLGFSLSWWLIGMDNFWQGLIAFGIGLIFMFGCWYLNKLMHGLSNDGNRQPISSLVGQYVTIMIYDKKRGFAYGSTVHNGAFSEFKVRSDGKLDYKYGSTAEIIRVENDTLIIP